MNTQSHYLKNERGITALETAIILIAFVVVAAIFAFTVLSTGTFLTERSKEASYAGLQEVRGSMELKGSVVIAATVAKGDTIIFNLANVAGGSSQDLSKVKITYRDSANNTELTFKSGATAPTDTSSNEWAAIDLDTGAALTNGILSQGKIAKIVLDPPTTLVANQTFAMEVKPPTGGVLLVERTVPAQIDSVTDLH
jgi:flagellin FlaB